MLTKNSQVHRIVQYSLSVGYCKLLHEDGPYVQLNKQNTVFQQKMKCCLKKKSETNPDKNKLEKKEKRREKKKTQPILKDDIRLAVTVRYIKII